MDFKNLWEHWDFTVSIKVICKQYNIWLLINGTVFFCSFILTKEEYLHFLTRAVFCRQLNFRVVFKVPGSKGDINKHGPPDALTRAKWWKTLIWCLLLNLWIWNSPCKRVFFSFFSFPNLIYYRIFWAAYCLGAHICLSCVCFKASSEQKHFRYAYRTILGSNFKCIIDLLHY